MLMHDYRITSYNVCYTKLLRGRLLDNRCVYSVVKSNQFGIMQHDTFSWIIEDDDFVYVKKTSLISNHFSLTLNKWVNSTTPENREQFVNTIYEILSASEAKSVLDLGENWQKKLRLVINHSKNMDKEVKKVITKTIKEMVLSQLRTC